jgi:hypothetical protein
VTPRRRWLFRDHRGLAKRAQRHALPAAVAGVARLVPVSVLTVLVRARAQAASLPRPDDEDGLDALRESLDMRCFFLTAPRVPLCRRIDSRCGQMLTSAALQSRSATPRTGWSRLLRPWRVV